MAPVNAPRRPLAAELLAWHKQRSGEPLRLALEWRAGRLRVCPVEKDVRKLVRGIKARPFVRVLVAPQNHDWTRAFRPRECIHVRARELRSDHDYAMALKDAHHILDWP